jgi:serine/threonine protein kinase
MSPITQLVGFGLRQVIGDHADGAVQIVAVIEQRLRDHSRTLPKALDHAHHRAWQALGVALAGDGLLDRVKVLFASGDDKGVREQVQLFLDGNAVSFDGTPADFRRDCLDELKRLRKSGRLSTPEGAHAAVARQAAGFTRHTDPQGLVEEARRAVNGVADALAENYPNLARLLRTPTPAGPPLLAAAFCYFFRREVETNDELAHGLFFDGLRQLSASQAKAFGEVGQALASLGGQFDALLEQLGRIEAAVEETHTVAVETHGAVLDLQTELHWLGGQHLAHTEVIRTLTEQVQLLLAQAGMARGEVRPGNSCSIRGEDERRAVKALLTRFRELPAEEQRQAPALLNGLGKLQLGAGDFTEARQTFTEVVQVVGNPADKAEASFNAYRAALEEKKWDAALSALREAGSHDPQRFAPFPLHRYEPKRILGAGGFGTAILCHDSNFDEDVVVKTLHTADLARGVDEVFREARILRRLSHPAIIGVRDCEYADPAHKARPYLVMDHFPGGTLQEFVEERGPLGLEQVLAVAVQVAEGMIAAHAQGVLHRDLKPANLLVRKEGDVWTVKIIDFGLALRQQSVETSRSRSGATHKNMLDWSVAGTLDYAPPEQLAKLPSVQPGPYSDVYAFGKTCCYAMFKATAPGRKQWNSLPGPLADLLEGCLEPDPKQRPNSFERLLASLGECSRAGDETRLREQEERLRQEQEEEQRRQKEGEEQLHQLVQAAIDRTEGKPTPTDTAAANELRRRHRIPREQAKAIIRRVWEQWQKERSSEVQPDPSVQHVRTLKTTGEHPAVFLVQPDPSDQQRVRTLLEQWQKERSSEVQPGMIRPASQGYSTVELTVPGNWHARPVDKPQAELTWAQEGSGKDAVWTVRQGDNSTEWTWVQETPGAVSLRPGEVYHLQVSSIVTDEQLASLAPLRGQPVLQSLDLSGCRDVTDAGLAHLRGITALRSLNLKACPQLTDFGLSHLREFTALKSLNLSACRNVTDAGLAYLRGFTALQSLDLSGCQNVTAAGLAHLRGLTALQSLNLEWCKLVTDAGLAHLRRLTTLQSLNLEWCGLVTDTGLAHLRGLTALQSLNLKACDRVTDAGLAHLGRLTALQSLNLECRLVTDAGRAVIRSALPQCQVYS